jgi:AcrR family transcriptional regulator
MREKKAREVRRKEILNAAMRCYSKKGYHATTMDDITRESGLTKGGIYWHFKSKWEIFIEMLREHKKVHLALWDRIDRIGVKRDALIEGGLLFLKEYIDNEWLFNVNKELAIEATRNVEVREELVSMYDEIKGNIRRQFLKGYEQGLTRELDLESTAIILVAVVEGILNHYWQSGKTLDYERIWRSFCDSFFKGVLKPSAQE